MLSVNIRTVIVGSAMFLGTTSAARPANAQSTDVRWQPWLGCWSGQPSRPADDATAEGLLCVRPSATGAGVDIETLQKGQVVERQYVNATGERIQVTRDGCPGWESAVWSQDGRRVLLRSEFTCGANIHRQGSGVIAMSSLGEWMQITGVTVNGNSAVHALRYRPVDAPRSDVSPTRAVASARSNAGARVTPENVLEVAVNVDPPVAEAWLIEVQPEFTLKGPDFVKLSHAGMPARMIDLMAALANPSVFSIKRNPRGVTTETVRVAENETSTPAYVQWSPFYSDGFGYGNGFRYSRLGYYGNSPYYSNNYSRIGYYGSTYYWGQQPIVINTIEKAPDLPQGRAVFGQGYTRGISSVPTTSTETRGRTTPSTTVQPTTGGSVGGSGGSSTGRTAHARPPG